jgi:uncharacterized repeat protein (TIGR02543 family)
LTYPCKYVTIGIILLKREISKITRGIIKMKTLRKSASLLLAFILALPLFAAATPEAEAWQFFECGRVRCWTHYMGGGFGEPCRMRLRRTTDGWEELCEHGEGPIFRYTGTAAKIRVPEGVRGIDSLSNRVREIRLSSTVWSVDGLYSARNLEKVTVSRNHPEFFARNGVLYSIRERDGVQYFTLQYYPMQKENHTYTILAGTTEIWHFNSRKLTNLTIPSSVTRIRRNAFAGSENLVIYGNRNSFAHRYARNNRITFSTSRPGRAARVTFHAQGGRIGARARSRVTVENTVGQRIRRPRNPVRRGYQFLGWYTRRTGGTKVSRNTVVLETSRTYHAQWRKR